MQTMSEATIKKVLDITGSNRNITISAVKNDYGSRFINAVLAADGEPIAVKSTEAVVINAKRADGNGKAFPGEVNSDGSVTVPVTQWMLDIPGTRTECTVSVLEAGKGKYSATPFYINVNDTPYEGDDVSPDDPEYDLLMEVLAGEKERVAAEEIRRADENARKAAEAARITAEDQRKADEAVRISNEEARVIAEQNRKDTFAGWVGDIGEIGNYGKRLDVLEAAVYGDLAQEVENSEVAYIKDVPASALGAVKVSMIGGMTRKCAQLFDKSKAVIGKGIGNTGVPYTWNGGFYSAPIAVTEGKTYAFAAISWYNFFSDDGEPSSNNLVSGASSGAFVTIPSGAKFVRISATVANIDLVMINEGSTALPYEPYFEGLRSAPVEKVESMGVNILDEEWEVGALSTESGKKIVTSDSIRTENFCKLAPNTKYHVHTPNTGLYILYYDANYMFISAALRNAANGYHFVSPTKARYFKAYTQTAEYGTTYKNDICVNKYDEAINGKYYPYVKHTLPIPEAVRPAHGINANAHDSITWDEDGKRRKHVKCGVVDMGTLAWDYSSADKRFYVVTTAIAKVGDGQVMNAICAAYTPVSFTAFYQNMTVDNTMARTGDYFFVRNLSYTDPATFKAAMSGVMLVYELATPTTEDISDILPADNYIEVEGGGTLTFKNEYEYDVPSEVTFVTKEVSA